MAKYIPRFVIYVPHYQEQLVSFQGIALPCRKCFVVEDGKSGLDTAIKWASGWGHLTKASWENIIIPDEEYQEIVKQSELSPHIPKVIHKIPQSRIREIQLSLVKETNFGYGLWVFEVEERKKGGRAWKVRDSSNRIFDLRESQLLYAITEIGIQSGGFIPTIYHFGKNHTQMQLLLKGSPEWLESLTEKQRKCYLQED